MIQRTRHSPGISQMDPRKTSWLLEIHGASIPDEAIREVLIVHGICNAEDKLLSPFMHSEWRRFYSALDHQVTQWGRELPDLLSTAGGTSHTLASCLRRAEHIRILRRLMDIASARQSAAGIAHIQITPEARQYADHDELPDILEWLRSWGDELVPASAESLIEWRFPEIAFPWCQIPSIERWSWLHSACARLASIARDGQPYDEQYFGANAANVRNKRLRIKIMEHLAIQAMRFHTQLAPPAPATTTQGEPHA